MRATVLLVVAIGIDQLGFDEMVESWTAGYLDPQIVKWLIYPAILAIAAELQHLKKRRAEQKLDDEKKERRMKYSQPGF